MVSESKRLFQGWMADPAPRFRSAGGNDADLVVEFGKVRLVIALKAAGDAISVAKAAELADGSAPSFGARAQPVVGVPYMGDVGKSVCTELGVSWFDLSGNADITAPGLRILVEGKSNQFVRRGRPSNAFAPKSARIARHLLIDPSKSCRQQDLAREVNLDDGFTSKIVRRLEEAQLVARDRERAIRVVSPTLLLDAWREAYDFNKHTIIKGHIAARDSAELSSKMGKVFQAAGLKHAATGLAGAWRYSPFAMFRTVTFFVEEKPSAAVIKELFFRDEPRGANVWLVVPNDEGVFDGASVVDGVMCAHPVQVYLDLQAHPERAAEAADELRKRHLQWGEP
jgi:hypothetical protein